MVLHSETAPYGAWKSPITGELLAGAEVGLGWLHLDGDDAYWVEMRPGEGGRHVIVRRTPDGAVSDVTPEGANARTLVHEYGGGMYAVQDGVVIFANFADQRLYRQPPGQAPQPITPEPELPRGLRYADMRFTPDGQHVVCVRERHREAGEAVNELVLLPADGSAEPQVIASGCDFYSTPRISPDGSRLAWLSWNHTNMPWDGTELWVAELRDGALVNEQRVAGGPEESIFQPAWGPGGALHFVSDRTNWWNLYRLEGGEAVNLTPMAAEFGQPHWVFDLSRYDFLPDGRIAAYYSLGGFDSLALVGGPGQPVQTLETTFTVIDSLRTRDGELWFLGANATHGLAVVRYDLDSGQAERIRRSGEVEVDGAFLSIPEPISFPTTGGETAHALYYPPANPHYVGPEGERPPLIVISHGGPTGVTKAQLRLSTNFWTSRGFGVVDVNYRGSSGYGRAYRDALKGQWGVADVDDSIAAARYLAERGEVDGDRVAIRGGSAGGYTTLCALAFRDFFKAGASYYGLAELEVFVESTHKFESRYLESLIGRWPEQKDLYYERSPVNYCDNISCPVILLQGLEDKVVPPSQAEIMVAALEKKGLPYAYLAFEGEQHGFRKAETIQRAAEAELTFYGRVFGFEPADDIEPVDIRHAGALG